MTQSMQTWTYLGHHPESDGPWASEPDKAQWIDEATDLDCLIVRNHSGALCGYVGVPPGHPWHGVEYTHIEDDVRVHGGLTFSEFCYEGVDMETTAAICHVPQPGRPDHVWWLGFDCAHCGDLIPRYAGHPVLGGPHETYRDLDYVMAEVRQLAAQVKAAATP